MQRDKGIRRRDLAPNHQRDLHPQIGSQKSGGIATRPAADYNNLFSYRYS
jgi:hypothetical protein